MHNNLRVSFAKFTKKNLDLSRQDDFDIENVLAMATEATRSPEEEN